MKLMRYHNHQPQHSLSGLGYSPLFDLANRLSRFPFDFGEFVDQAQSDAQLFEDDEHFYARFELPGIKRDDLHVDLNGNQLELSVSRESDSKEDESQSSFSFERSISVPEGIDPEGVSAKLEDGILTVTMPKLEERKPRTIKVS
ncbi:MAG: Hsp20/alpha crystallin family protein [Verrucomicrobiales bacterium]|nr:Hsp20/alpha crystallin family protein [Verrucomicrobiales bacterium]